MSYRESYNSQKDRSTVNAYIYGVADKHLLIEETFDGYKRTTTADYYGLETGNWSSAKITTTVNGNSATFTAITHGLSSTCYLIGAKADSLSSEKNIYLTVKGGHSWYFIDGVFSIGSGRVFNNLHMNVENLSGTTGQVVGVYTGTSFTANSVTVYLSDVVSTYFSSIYGVSATIKETNLVVDGSKSRKISYLYAGGYSASTTTTITLDSTINVRINGGVINNVYGGGSSITNIVVGEINIDVTGGTITDLYGGGLRTDMLEKRIKKHLLI